MLKIRVRNRCSTLRLQRYITTYACTKLNLLTAYSSEAVISFFSGEDGERLTEVLFDGSDDDLAMEDEDTNDSEPDFEPFEVLDEGNKYINAHNNTKCIYVRFSMSSAMSDETTVDEVSDNEISPGSDWQPREERRERSRGRGRGRGRGGGRGRGRGRGSRGRGNSREGRGGDRQTPGQVCRRDRGEQSVTALPADVDSGQ